jgi:hypothetical protein
LAMRSAAVSSKLHIYVRFEFLSFRF